MKIQKSAWHFQFFTMGFDSGYSGQAANLCSYFWRVVAGMLKIVCMVAVLLCVAVGVGSMVFQFPLYCLALVVGTTAVVNAPRIAKRGKSKRGLCEPGLLRAYLRARKDKVCPLIEFVE